MKNIIKFLYAALIVLMFPGVALAVCNVPICTEQGGARMTIGSGGSLDVESGGELDIESGGALKIGGISATATAAELNYLDITTLGTGAASKAVVLDAGEDYTWPTAGVLTYGGTAVTANGAEMNYLDLTTLGTGAASKAVVLDTGEDYTWPTAGVLTYGGTGITSTGAELNILDGVTANTGELNTLDKSVKSVLFDDFHGTWLITDAGPADQWSSTAGNGTTPVIATTVTAALNGEVTMKSASDDGANSANNATFTSIGLAYQADQGGLANEVRVKIDDITEAYLFVGFTDVISTTVESPITFTDGTDTLIADAGDACGIVFTGDSTTQEWAQGGVKATAVTAGSFSGTAPVNDTYVVLRVEVSATGGCRGFVNGTAIAAETADAITATTAVTPSIVVGNTAAAQTIATIDYIKVEQNR